MDAAWVWQFDGPSCVGRGPWTSSWAQRPLDVTLPFPTTTPSHSQNRTPPPPLALRLWLSATAETCRQSRGDCHLSPTRLRAVRAPIFALPAAGNVETTSRPLARVGHAGTHTHTHKTTARVAFGPRPPTLPRTHAHSPLHRQAPSGGHAPRAPPHLTVVGVRSCCSAQHTAFGLQNQAGLCGARSFPPLWFLLRCRVWSCHRPPTIPLRRISFVRLPPSLSPRARPDCNSDGRSSDPTKKLIQRTWRKKASSLFVSDCLVSHWHRRTPHPIVQVKCCTPDRASRSTSVGTLYL